MLAGLPVLISRPADPSVSLPLNAMVLPSPAPMPPIATDELTAPIPPPVFPSGFVPVRSIPIRLPLIDELGQTWSEMAPPPFPLIRLPWPAAAPPTTTEEPWQLMPRELGI